MSKKEDTKPVNERTEAQKLLEEYVDNNYSEETDLIAKKNLHLSMKLSGLLSMMDAYFTEYHQNKRQIVHLAKTMVLEKKEPSSLDFKKHVNQKTQNQLNKLDNQAQAFEKMVKRFTPEFSDLFNDTDLADQLIDTFEEFWEDTVTIDDKTVTIKTKN